MSELVGQLESERVAEENQQCREIVKEIMDFGTNQRQILVIMRLLAFELEDIDACREIVGCLDEVGGSLQRVTDVMGGE